MKDVSPTPSSLSSVIAKTLHGCLEGALPDHHQPDSPKGLVPSQRVAVYLRKLDRQRKCADSLIDSHSVVSPQRAFRSTSGVHLLIMVAISLKFEYMHVYTNHRLNHPLIL